MSFEGIEVLEIQPDFLTPPRFSQTRATDGNRLGRGPGVLTYRGRRPVHMMNFRWSFIAAAELDALEDFFFDHAGKWKAFWSPSWAGELELHSNFNALSNSIQVKLTDYEVSYPVDGSNSIGNVIWILDQDGTFQILRISSVVDNGTHSTLTTAAGASKTYVAGEVLVGFMYRVRFMNDELAASFNGPEISEVSLGLIEVLEIQAEADATESTIEDAQAFLDATYLAAPYAGGPAVVRVSFTYGLAAIDYPDDFAWDFMEDYSDGISPTINQGQGWNLPATTAAVI